MFKSIKKYLVLLILIITAALTSVGYSAFVLSERVSKEGAQSGILNSSPVVSIKYETISTVSTPGNTEPEFSGERTGLSTEYSKYYDMFKKTNGKITYKSFLGFYFDIKYEKGNKETYGPVNNNDLVIDSNGNSTWTETTYYCDLLISATLGSDTYYGINVTKVTTSYFYGSYVEIDENTQEQKIFHQFVLNRNEKLIEPKLTRNNYSFVGFFKSDSTGTKSIETPFDFSLPITTNTTIFAKWSYLLDSEGNKSTEFADYVNSVKSGEIKNVYANSPDYNVENDPSYSTTMKNLSLDSAVIKSGATINLCMNNGDTDINAQEGEIISDSIRSSSVNSEDKYISLDYTTKDNVVNERDYTVILQGDLTINGKLVIGGWTGNSADGVGEQGYIIKSYVSLDLNGHNIYINDGGILHSFGLIKDSKGTGRIDVSPGGYLYTHLVVLDLNGGNNTLWSYVKNYCPFNNYLLPYLQCKVRFFANESKSANMILFSKLNFGGLGFTNLYFPFMGSNTSSTTFMFNYLAKSGYENSAYVDYDYKELKELHATTAAYEEKQQVYIRNIFTFKNINGNVDAAKSDGIININKSVTVFGTTVNIDINKDFTLLFNRVGFPISSMVSFYFENSDLKLLQKIVAQPGSVIEFDKNSNLIFDYVKDANGTPVLSEFPAVNVSENYIVISVSKTLPAESKFMAGSLIALDRNPMGSIKLSTSATDSRLLTGLYNIYGSGPKKFWDHFSSATINIYGNIKFVKGCYHRSYVLAGKINVNTFSIDNGVRYSLNTDNLNILVNNKVHLKTYAVEYNVTNSRWFDSSDTDALLDETNSTAYTQASHCYTLPLISKGIAYLFGCEYSDSSTSNIVSNMYGNYDLDTGIFTNFGETSNNNYFLKSSDRILAYNYSTTDTVTTTGDLQDSDVDCSVVPVKCTVNDAEHCVVYDGNKYVYYAGTMIMVPTVTGYGINVGTDSVTAVVSLAKFTSNVAVPTRYQNISIVYNNDTQNWTLK